MNDKNLEGYGFDERAPNEQRKIARQGGIASGKARKQKADMRKAVQGILDGKFVVEGEQLKRFRIGESHDYILYM